MSGLADGGVEADEIVVRPIVPGDAPGLRDLIARCYGDAYPKRVMYRPDELAQLVRARTLNGVVATAADVVVGHIGFTWPTPAATVVEAGTTAVDPGYRAQGLMGRLALALSELVIADGAAGFIHFPTTAHLVLQRASLGAGGRETGVMLAYLPPEATDRVIGASAGGRLAVTVVYQPLAEASAQSIFIPSRYEDLIAGMADGLGLRRSAQRTFRAPSEPSRLEHASDAARRLTRISVDRIGADIATQVAPLMATTDASLAHVDLPMNDAGIDHAVDQLGQSGFAFAAWLPGWAGHDVLRLQSVADPSEGELSPTLFSPEAQSLMTRIRAELPRTQSER